MAGNPALWADVKRDLDIAENTCAVAVSRTKSLEDRGDKMDRDVREDRERMVGSLLHDCYSAMEGSLERLVVAIDGDRPIGTDYHAQLIQRAATEIEGVR